MKYSIKLCLAAMVLFSISCSKEEPIESITQDEIVSTDMSKFLNYLKELHSSDSSVQKRGGENNGNAPFFVHVASDYPELFEIIAVIGIPNTTLVIYSHYPINGEDNALINGEWIMANWTTSATKTFIIDFADGLIKYSNWCEDNKEGVAHLNIRAKLIETDRDQDGITDWYHWDINAEDSGVNAHGTFTLTDAQIQQPWAWPVEGE